MYRPRHSQPTSRRGIILLIVLALLTLFAIVGISFVLYANSEANGSRYFRQSEAPPQPDMDPELLVSMFLGQLIYDVNDDTGLYSAMRGHSLARNMYGYYYPRLGANDQNFPNIYAFNGTGRLRGAPVPATLQPPPIGPDKRLNGTSPPFDDFYCINYEAFPGPTPLKTWIHDPERPGWRRPIAAGGSDGKLPYMGGFNPPYTYPDLNNMFLGAVKAGPLELPGMPIDPKTAGAVLIQSFFRPWLFNNGYNPQTKAYDYYSLDSPNNPNWHNAIGKYLTLRPRPDDQKVNGQTTFPYPEDPGGDVKNLINSPGYLVDVQGGKPVFANNDSLWMDLGAPVMTAPDGTKFKPLFAPLIIDLDNRINLNVHGNIRGRAGSHVSDQGWGPWEVNINRVLNLPNQPNEWSQLFADLYAGVNPIEGGRYFYGDPFAGHIPLSQFPSANTAGSGDVPHAWAPVDFDGGDETSGGSSGRLSTWLRAVQNGGLWYCPSFPAIPTGYGNGDPAERLNHPLIYNFFNPYQDPTLASKRNLVFPISNMEAILRYGETNSPGLTSSLFRLCAANFGDPNFEQIPPPAYQQIPPLPPVGTWTGGASRRNMVTTHSFGLDRPGMSPWFWGNKGTDVNNILSFGIVNRDGSVTDYSADPTNPIVPNSDPIPSPPLNTTVAQLQGSDFQLNQDGNKPPNISSDRRALGAALSKLDLNRKLTPYPISKSRRNPLQAFNPLTNPVTVFNLTPNSPISNQYLQADKERRQFAQDILTYLMRATGAFNPQMPPPAAYDATGKNLLYPKAQHVYAVAYLAQLAVNIVDFIDDDDIMTGLPWLDFVAPPGLDDPLKNPLLHEFRKVATTPKNDGGCGFTPGPNQWVWGTELPRVLLNEVYGEFNLTSDSGDPSKNMGKYQVDLWVELYNPLPAEPIPGNAKQELADPTANYAYLQLPGAVNSGAGLGAYRLELYRPLNDPPPGTTATLHQMSNTTGEGEPTQFFLKTVGGQPCKTTQFSPTAIGAGNVPLSAFIAPSGGRYNGLNRGNTGFYVIGPQLPGGPPGTPKTFPSNPKGGPKPNPTPPIATFGDPNMSYQLLQGGAGPSGLKNGQKPFDVPPTVVLQRLANPYLPWQSVSNPFVTIDFLTLQGHFPPGTPSGLNDAVDSKKYVDNEFVQLEKRAAWAKKDPFDSLFGDIQAETDTLLKPKNTGQPQHTFFRHNGTGRNQPGMPKDQILSLPFGWVPHPDRQLISPMELLMVSGYKPAELTQRFPLAPYQHFAPWFVNSYNQAPNYTTDPGLHPDHNRLFRFFEYVETNNRATGVARGGRIPGLVNLNTVWDPEILMALCDPQPGNFFTDTDIYKPLALEKNANQNKYDSIYWRLMNMRSPSLLRGGGAGRSPDFKDQPFLGHAPPIVPANDLQYPLGSGVANSFWRIDTDTLNRSRFLFQRAPLFTDSDPKTLGNDPSLAHPYVEDGIMHKLFNNVTTRSNVFAVWVTVGFFQVTDDTVRPVKLGAEIGKAENRNIRHRMFAIVDRSNLTIDNDPSNAKNPGPPIFLEGSLETFQQPFNQSSPIPILSIAGAQYNPPPKAGQPATLSGFYEGIPWRIAPGSFLQTEVQAGDVQVVSVNPPGTIPDTFNLDPTARILSPTITVSGLSSTITSPMYLMPENVGTTTQQLPFALGNPGPKPGFNPRNYPWIVRYFSIIH